MHPFPFESLVNFPQNLLHDDKLTSAGLGRLM